MSEKKLEICFPTLRAECSPVGLNQDQAQTSGGIVGRMTCNIIFISSVIQKGFCHYFIFALPPFPRGFIVRIESG